MLPSDGARKKPELGTGKKKTERGRDTQREREEEREERAAKTRGDLTPPENAFPGR